MFEVDGPRLRVSAGLPRVHAACHQPCTFPEL
jgi:hypothetical protein